MSDLQTIAARGGAWQRLVRVHDQADRAEQDEESGRRGHRRVPGRGAVAAGAVHEPERQGDEQAAGEPGAGVELERELQQAAERGGDPVVERGISEPAQAGDLGREQARAAGHAVGDAQVHGVERLPGIVPGKAGQEERRREERQRGGRRGQLQAGQHAPRATSASSCSGG